MVQHYKTIFIALIVAAGGILLEKSLNTQSDASNDNHVTVNTSTNDSAKTTTQLQQQIHLLRAENNLLRERLSAFANNSSAPKDIQNNNIKPESDSVTANEDMLNRLQTLEMEKQQRKANDFGNWIMRSQSSDGQFNLNDELAYRFEQEARDPIWAEQEENHYQQLFSTRDEFREFALRDAQCRNTQCEVTVSIANPEQSLQLLQAINNTQQDTEVLLVTDEQNGISKLYISSSKKGFEFN